ncbi:MAG TPA: hypothetical protein EYP60_01810 [bacterium (Candidatus Stahlbacteria)]|nr:hypothetical protein [Candidatus Stahlbacteria bacterium]
MMLNMTSKKIVPFEEIERRAIVYALRMSNGNISKAAKELHIGRTTFYRKIQKYGLRIRRAPKV